jgi:3',5'-nucleoside bisphosphate phosphatase
MLLGDFHIHTTWSDGKLPLPEVVDLFGRAGHDVIAITDHVVNRDSLLGKAAHALHFSVTRESWSAYRTEIEREARRARDVYGMLVLAGCELTRNATTSGRSAHALALGLDDFVPADGPIEDVLSRARAAGAVTVACHPNEQSDWFANTFHIWNRRKELSSLLDLWELACRWDLFPEVSRASLPFIGNSDFHRPEHLSGWKTLLECEKTESAVLHALRTGSGLAVARPIRPAAAAKEPVPLAGRACPEALPA